jgi:hypothetical protein
MVQIKRLTVRLAADTDDENEVGVTWYTVGHAKGEFVQWLQVLDVIAERDTALARLKELEALTVDQRLSLTKWNQRSAAQEARIAELETLTAEQRLAIAGWTETAAAQQARITKLEIDVAEDACNRVVARYKEDATIPGATWLEDRLKRLAGLEKLLTTSQESKLTDLASLRELAAIRKDAIAHGFREEGVTASGDGLAAWLDRKLTDLAGVRDRLAERLLPVAREHGYEDNSESLGDWLEKLIRHFASDRQLSHLAQSFRNSDPGPAGESLEQWLTDRLQLLAHLQVLLHRVQKMGKI